MTLGRENIDRGDDLEVVWRGHLALVPPQEGIPCHPDPPAHQVKGCSRCFANAKSPNFLYCLTRQMVSLPLYSEESDAQRGHRIALGHIARLYIQPSGSTDSLSTPCRLRASFCKRSSLLSPRCFARSLAPCPLGLFGFWRLLGSTIQIIGNKPSPDCIALRRRLGLLPRCETLTKFPNPTMSRFPWDS